MQDIPDYKNFTKIEPLTKGWSSDKKFYIETVDGRRLLLRLADSKEHDKKKLEFDMMQKVAALGIPMSQPIEFGTCGNGKQVYQLLSWCDGEDAQIAMPNLTEDEQYAIGIKAGQILKQMQQLQTSPPSNEWAMQCEAKHARYIANYRNCGMTFDGDELLIRYVESNHQLLENRPMCFSHDDYHLGNLILSPDNTLHVIDFQKFRNVEPYHAMCGLVFSANTSPHFATGQLRGYFDGEPPMVFWQTLALYMAAISINFLPWSIPYGQADIDFAYQQIADVLAWYDNMNNPVPTWYACGEQSLRGNHCKLGENLCNC